MPSTSCIRWPRASAPPSNSTRRAFDSPPAHPYHRRHIRPGTMREEESTMNRRVFLTTTAAGAATFAFPAVLRAQSKDPIRIGFPAPLTGPFSAIAADVQMAINEQTKKAKVLFISTSQSDEISAKPDTSPITFHEALNPTITSRVVGKWVMENLGKKWWIVYADYAWGKQNNMVLSETNKKHGGTVLGNTPYPLGSAEFSAHLPKIQAAKPDVLVNVAPGADNVALHKQIKSFGMDKTMKLAQPLLWISVAKQGGPELYQDIYGGMNFYWELQDGNPDVKR